MKKRATRALFIATSLIFLLATGSSAGQDFQVGKQTAIQQVRFKKPVKVKLKRLADGKYTWDLTGDDVDEVVRADKRMRKLLKVE